MPKVTKAFPNRITVSFSDEQVTQINNIMATEELASQSEAIRKVVDETTRLLPWFEQRLQMFQTHIAHHMKSQDENQQVLIEAFLEMKKSVDTLLEEAEVEEEEEGDHGDTYQSPSGELVDRKEWVAKQASA